MKGFRDFLLRGNVVDLAVAVVIGTAFGVVITAFVKDILTPLITIPGKTDFSQLTAKVGGGVFKYGDFINALISFIIIAAAIYFLVVLPMQKLLARRRTDTAAGPTTRECPRCLSSVPQAATRCAFCTSDLTPEVPAA